MKCIIEDLSFHHEEHPVFRRQSLSFEGPGLVAIFGPNGGGKTTLMKLLAGLEKPARGMLTYDGQLPRALYPHVGWVPQLFQVDPLFPISVKEIVLGGVYSLPRNTRQEAVIHALESVGMSKELHTDFAALSGGERMRVLLARALASQPKLLFLDEATAHMDVPSKERLFTLLKKLKKNILIFFVTHELSSAQELADHLLFVDKKISKLQPSEVCGHFSQGLFHPPLSGGLS